MPRLMGVDIPNDKQIQYSLTYLYGVGLNARLNPAMLAGLGGFDLCGAG